MHRPLTLIPWFLDWLIDSGLESMEGAMFFSTPRHQYTLSIETKGGFQAHSSIEAWLSAYSSHRAHHHGLWLCAVYFFFCLSALAFFPRAARLKNLASSSKSGKCSTRCSMTTWKLTTMCSSAKSIKDARTHAHKRECSFSSLFHTDAKYLDYQRHQETRNQYRNVFLPHRASCLRSR